jgi:hypothetical protein
LSRSDPLLPEFSPFMLDMLEVVDSPAELPKCVATWNEQESEAPARNYKNRTARFEKLDGPDLSRSTTVKGTTGLRWGAPPLAKWHMDGGEAWTTTTLEVVTVNSRSNQRKNKKNRKTRAKGWKV